MTHDDKEPESDSEDIQLFTIAFNPKTSEVAFLGSMPTEQALGLMQQVMREAQKAQIRREVEAEMEADASTPEVVP